MKRIVTLILSFCCFASLAQAQGNHVLTINNQATSKIQVNIEYCTKEACMAYPPFIAKAGKTVREIIPGSAVTKVLVSAKLKGGVKCKTKMPEQGREIYTHTIVEAIAMTDDFCSIDIQQAR